MVVIERNEYDTNDFYRLKDNSWCGALDTLNDIEKAHKEEEFMELLNTYFPDEIDKTQLNDFIWFERDTIYNDLGLDENGELINKDE